MRKRGDHGFIIPLVAFLVIGAFVALAIFTTSYNQTIDLRLSDIDL